jgi:hypothetical protein
MAGKGGAGEGEEAFVTAGPDEGREAGEALVEDDDGVGDGVGGVGGRRRRGGEEEGGGVGHRRERHGGRSSERWEVAWRGRRGRWGAEEKDKKRRGDARRTCTCVVGHKVWSAWRLLALWRGEEVVETKGGRRGPRVRRRSGESGIA